MATRAPVITGLGIVTAAGIGADEVWHSISHGLSRLTPLTLFQSPRYGQIPVGEIQRDLTALGAPLRGSRSDRLGWLAARDAIRSSGIDMPACAERAGLVLGTSVGGSFDSERFLTTLIKHGKMRARPTRFHECASSVDLIADHFGLLGPSMAVATACSSGGLAIATAAEMIEAGEADVMLAGGAEAPLAPLCFGAFAIIRAMSTRNDDPAHASRPFDAGRDGFVMAEGAAVVVLEERGRALARGAPVYAEVCGYGLTNDAHHMTAPRPDGTQAARAMRNALAEAHVSPGEVGYINAHGSSTPLNDSTETGSIKQVFGEAAYRVPLSGTKGYYGHALGASGAIEAAICALAARRGWLPPTVNLETPDPACDLPSVTGEGRDLSPEVLLSNSFGFGGINAALVFRRADA